jgi:trehalose-phosphatase
MNQHAPRQFDFGLFRRTPAPPQRLLLLDYDGTLAPFKANRSEAVPYRGVRRVLSEVLAAPQSRAVVISGRSVTELRGLLGDRIPVEIWGAHGWERLTSDNELTKWTPEPSKQAALSEAQVAIRKIVSDELIEAKTASTAVHLRPLALAEADRVRSATQEVWRGYVERSGLELMTFDGGLELRDPSRTKATAVEAMLRESVPGTFVAYLGDDRTDADAFERIGDRGWSILVASDVRPSSAGFSLTPPGDVLRFLRAWAKWFSVTGTQP